MASSGETWGTDIHSSKNSAEELMKKSREFEQDSPARNRLSNRTEINNAPPAQAKEWIERFDKSKEDIVSRIKVIFD
jgi:hypothetical protein